mmetsp:Transcript_21956/g.37684  ORF Transcript_21956/g.37684 Transcript_21956/m.37684 type:complete len:248 (+) Transcript_21956:119-862(+)
MDLPPFTRSVPGGSNGNNGTIGTETHRLPHHLARTLSIHIPSDLRPVRNGIVESVHPHVSGIVAVAIVVACTDGQRVAVRGEVDGLPRLILRRFAVNVSSGLVPLPIIVPSISVHANMTRRAFAINGANGHGRTRGRQRHGVSRIAAFGSAHDPLTQGSPIVGRVAPSIDPHGTVPIVGRPNRQGEPIGSKGDGIPRQSAGIAIDVSSHLIPLGIFLVPSVHSDVSRVESAAAIVRSPDRDDSTVLR